MNRTNSNMDGFVLRRRAQNSDMSRQRPSLAGTHTVPERFLIDPTKRPEATHDKSTPVLRRAAGPAAIATNSLELPKPNRDSLNIDLTLDDEKQPEKLGKKVKKQRKSRKKWSVKKIVLVVVALLVLAGLMYGGYFVYKFLATGGKIFQGNVVTALFEQGQPLQEDTNGRSNVLLFGTSEDDPGHPGQDLTDSIMVVSVDQDKKDAFVVSIPRDFHVQYGGPCVSGYQGKINVVYSCHKEEGEEVAAAALRTKVGEVLGLDIQYSAHVNYTVLREAVDAVGGIDVTIESEDPRGILDRNFDWQCNYKCHYVKYPNGPVHLDGIHALMLARARGDPTPYGTYGLGRSNPDRQDNQRKILIGLKEKAVSGGVLANPVAVNNLLETLGNNLRTNFQANEIKTLIELGKSVKTEDITSFSLENKEKPLATVSCFSGNMCPNAGNFNYSAIHAAMTALSTGDGASLEYAQIDVLNASGVVGLGQTEANKLADKNLKIGTVGNAPDALGAQPVSFYDLSGGKKPATLKKLKELLGVDVTPGAPAGVSSGADFVVIIGKQPEPAPAQQ